ncbi:hypothetical protein EUX98_g3219 [Antrodiella citrinella]|uniref:Uncharacterized protein n=1 Tax=Antrodiella citrinella TaxID=2447956 RepID=A0A4S4MZ91_9APHY|nr:hypothetical protein EUX98_g3219 [Antrodiella citrinella]
MAVITAASSEPQPPTNLTPESLLRAKGSELGQWIDLANKAAQEKAGNKKKVLIKTGKVESLRSRLADYYGFVLAAASGTDNTGVIVAGGGSHSQSAGTQVGGTSSTTSIASTNHEIRIRQWAYLRTLCDRWREAERTPGQELILVKNPLPGHFNSLARHPVPAARVAQLAPRMIQPAELPAQSLTGDPLKAALQDAAVRVSDVRVVATKYKQYSACTRESTWWFCASYHYEPIGSPARPYLAPTQSHDRDLTMVHVPAQPLITPPSPPVPRQQSEQSHSLIPASVGIGAPGRNTPNAHHASSRRTVTLSVLESCQPEAVIRSLQKASGLRDVIRQMKNGEVQAYRARYGPSSQGEGGSVARAHKDWNTLNVTITRRERIYREFLTEFKGDEDRFFKFFTVDLDDESNGSSSSARKRKHKSPDVEQLRPLRLVAEAIPHVNRDIEVEKARSLYRDPNTAEFSHELWEKKWEGCNKWEVWRELGKEVYRKSATTAS